MGYIKLNKSAFFHNLDYFSSICTKDKLSIALKDNAYGHGTFEVASMCQEYGIKHVFVRDMREAYMVKEFKFESILVLYDIPVVYNENIIVSINKLDDLNKVPKKSKIELKIDTGMNRNGISKEQIGEAIVLIIKNNLVLNGVFTHFCCADEDNDITQTQEELFLELVEDIRKIVKYHFRIHCANSVGVHKVDMTKYDLARVGIGAYGYLDIEKEKYLKPVMSLYAKKITTKYIKKGEHVGYGGSAYIASRDMIVSNYDIGYGDGFFRFSEKKFGYIANNKQILGRVSMDSFSVESNDEEVCVFDDVTKLANIQDTIKYVVLANLNFNIEKVII